MKNDSSHSSGKGPGRHHAPLRSTGAAVQAAPTPFSAAELRRISKQISAEWFRPVEASRLTLLEIDPWRVHAYWNLAEDEIAAARACMPHDFGGGGSDAALVLRFTDLSPETGEAAHHAHFDVEVEGASNNWYVDLWRDARRYSAELGVKAIGGSFIPLVRSNEVVTPRGGPSPELAFRHLEVRAPRPLETSEAVGTGAAAHSDALLKDLYPQRLLPEHGYPLAVAEGSDVLFEEPEFPDLGGGLEEAADEPAAATEVPPMDDVRNDPQATPGGPGFPLIERAEIERYHALAGKTKARVSANLAGHLPPVDRETVSPTDVELVSQPLPAWAHALPGGEPDTAAAGAGAGEIAAADTASAGAQPADIAPGDRSGQDLAPKPEPLFPPGTGSTGQTPYALERLLSDSGSSPGSGGLPVDGSVHLLIEGVSSPDRLPTIFGERVETQADGSFRVQLPLQRGPELAELLYRLRGRYGDRNED